MNHVSVENYANDVQDALRFIYKNREKYRYSGIQIWSWMLFPNAESISFSLIGNDGGMVFVLPGLCSKCKVPNL